jgi:flavin-dependent dehydrogenase
MGRAGRPVRWSATSHRLVRGVQPGRGTFPWLAVGDAALAVDPISGSGVVRALRTAAQAADALLAALSGDGEAVPAYDRGLDEACTRYLIERLGYYEAEGRYPDAPFWQRRHLRRAPRAHVVAS